MDTIHIIIVLLIIVIFFRINKESYGSCQVYSQRIDTNVNPSQGIQDILQYTQSSAEKCVKPDWATATPEDFSNYATCLNYQNYLTGILGKAVQTST